MLRLLILFVSFVLSRSAELVPPIERPEDGEPIPKLPGTVIYDHYTELSDMMGNLFAGRAEFPWIVDVRLVDEDQSTWSVGNLLTHKHVLSTCRWIGFYENYGTQPDFKGAPPVVHINYCTSYLWEKANGSLYTGGNTALYKTTKHESGTRLARILTAHPLCDYDPIKYDVGIIELARGIPTEVPTVSYMPIFLDEKRLEFSDFDLERHEREGIVCYVASFGRNYNNWKDHIAIDYKVKYRVYITPWVDCFDSLYFYECVPHKDRGLCDGPILHLEPVVLRAGAKHLMCFTSRAIVGAVCDHDLGAPLVCDGRVFGIVIRGAQMEYCSNRYPVPFVVLKSTIFSDYYMTLARAQYDFIGARRFDAKSKSYQSLPTNSLLILVTLLSVYAAKGIKL